MGKRNYRRLWELWGLRGDRLLWNVGRVCYLDFWVEFWEVGFFGGLNLGFGVIRIWFKF